MKKGLNNILGVIVLVTQIITSCTKSYDRVNTPTLTPVVVATFPSWSKTPIAIPATIFGLGLGETTISAEAINATSMIIVRISDGFTVKTVSGGSVSYQITGLIAPDSYKVVASNDKGEVSISVPISLYSDNVT